MQPFTYCGITIFIDGRVISSAGASPITDFECIAGAMVKTILQINDKSFFRMDG
jgi:hypothetical protein